MSLLPSEPDTSAAEESDLRVIGVDSDAADDLIAALSSETAREILAALHDDPAPPSQLADRVDTTLQNVQYHLENLADAGAVEVIDTAYSEKGREMDVYAPADRPLVIFAGEESRTPTLRQALSRLLGGIGVLALSSVVVQSLFGERGRFGSGSEPGSGYVGDNLTDGTETATTRMADGGADAGDAIETATETATEAEGTEDIARTAAETTLETATPTRGGTPTVTQPETVTQTATEAQSATATVSQTPTETMTQTEIATPTPTETSMETVTHTPTATETPIETVTETVTTVGPDGGGLPPGLLFFAGGLTALLAVIVIWYVWR